MVVELKRVKEAQQPVTLFKDKIIQGYMILDKSIIKEKIIKTTKTKGNQKKRSSKREHSPRIAEAYNKVQLQEQLKHTTSPLILRNQ